MRAIALLAVLTGPAFADPPKATPPPVKMPDLVKELIETSHAIILRDGAIGMDGRMAAGIVIKPGYHPDAELVSKGGSLIIPPDPNDPMAIEPGTNQLRSHKSVEAWLPRDLSRAMKHGADKVWDLVLPKL